MELSKYLLVLWLAHSTAFLKNFQNQCYFRTENDTKDNIFMCFAIKESIPYNNTLSNITEIFMYRSEFIQIHGSIFENFYHQLHSLTMSHGNLSSVDETSFSTLLELRELNLSFNKIRNVSEKAFINNNKLRSISLMSNKIHELKPNTFSTLIDLESIDLTRNNLNRLDKHLFMNNRNLTKLDLKFNNLSEIYNVMFHSLPMLSTLDLSFNKIQSIPAHIFKYNYALKKINLQGNKIKSLDFDLSHLGLAQLNLRGNPLNMSDDKNKEVIDELRQSEVQVKVTEHKHNQKEKDDLHKEASDNNALTFKFSAGMQFVFATILLLLIGIFVVLSLLLYNVHKRKRQKLLKRYYPDNRGSREYLNDARQSYLQLSVSDGSAVFHNKDDDDRTEDHEESCACSKCLH